MQIEVFSNIHVDIEHDEQEMECVISLFIENCYR